MKNTLAISILSLLTACSAIPVDQTAQTVRLTHNEPGKECQFLGDVTGNQGDFFTGGFTSNAALETGARNDIKNKAALLGGDTIYILTQRSGQTGSYNGEYGGRTQQTNVTLSGNVYNCSIS